MQRNYSAGVTLIELVIAIVVLSIGLTALLSTVLETTRHSADPLVQQQASAVAQSYMEEILAQPFCDPDFSTDCFVDCTSATACTTCNPVVEGSRSQYDSVCDYDGISDVGAEDINGAIAGLGSYTVTVTIDDSGVTLGDAPDQLTSATGQVVQIDVDVTHTNGSSINLNAYKANF